MLAFAAFVPHPLISLPEIGKKQTVKLRETIESYRVLAEELYAAIPDLLVVFSPHTPQVPGAFTINQRPDIHVSFRKFGDLTDHLEFKNGLGFGYKVRESLESEMPIVLTEEEVLDYGVGVPLFYMTRGLDKERIQVVPIGSSDLSLSDHYKFGTHINRQINLTTERVAIIASGDLSHGTTHDSVAGYNTHAAEYNESIKRAIELKDTQSLLSISSEHLAGVSECSIRVLLMLVGVMDTRHYTPDVLSYEEVLGVDYLATNFLIR